MSNWVEMRLSEIAEINPHEVLKKGAVAKKVPMDKLQPYCRDIPEFIIEPYSGGAKFRNGDTIMARITPCLENGKIAQVNILDGNEVGFGSTEYIVFRARKGNDADFIYYLVSSSLVKEPAIKSMVGSSGRQRVQIDVIQNLLLKVPELKTQRAIASILKGLDDKIGENNKVNHNLQQQFQALFDSWFKRFEPFSQPKYESELGLIPEGWGIKDIYSISSIIYGAPFSSKLFNDEHNGAPIVRIRDLKTQNTSTYTTEIHPKGYLIKNGDIVVGMDGEFRPYIWGSGEAWLNQRVCVFENKRPKGKVFLYCSIKPLLNLIEQTEVATTVIHIGKQDFDAFRIVMPPIEILNAFDDITAPMYNRIVNNIMENHRLSALRDTLLPRLMSGEIDVSEVEI